MVAKIKKRALVNHSKGHKPKGIAAHEFNKVYWPYIPLVLFIGALGFLGLKSGNLTRGITHPGGEVLAYSISMEPRTLLADTNLERIQNHEPELKLSTKLMAAAQAKADNMAKLDYWSHNTPSGNPPWIFITAKHYQYQKAAENLAAGFNNEQSTIEGWMASPSHRHNLLDPAYRDAGFGIANIADYKAAGGGPMTIVVAFYGEPLSAADRSLLTSSSNGASYNTATSTLASVNTPQNSSRAKIGLANMHLYSFVSLSFLTISFLALAIWASRHILLLHKVLIRGEDFVFAHPMLDVCLLVVAALAFVLNQTTGFIL